MKTIAKIFVAVSIIMISVQAIAGGSSTQISRVHYWVNVLMPKEFPFYTRNVFVVMTDENNRMIAPAQLLRFGKDHYSFFEDTFVQGTRVAMLIYSDGTTSQVFHSFPDSQSGRFAPGSTYYFNLNVTIPDNGRNNNE